MKEVKDRKETGFSVPEGYFEHLNREILDATVKSRTGAVHRKRHTIGIFSRIAGYAAAVAILFAIAGNFLTTDSKDNANTENAENEYIDNILNSYPIDEYTFYCYLTDSDFE